MLPRAERLTRKGDFTLVLREGSRRRAGVVLVHVRRSDSGERARVGFIVGRQVGGSVERHRVTRRLRHLMRDRLPDLPGGSLVVVRALPGAAATPSRTLGASLDAALAPRTRRDSP